jgi:hypothetical protein
MMLASIESAHPGVDLHTFECAICNHVLKSLAAYADPMKSKGIPPAWAALSDVRGW